MKEVNKMAVKFATKNTKAPFRIVQMEIVAIERQGTNSVTFTKDTKGKTDADGHALKVENTFDQLEIARFVGKGNAGLQAQADPYLRSKPYTTKDGKQGFNHLVPVNPDLATAIMDKGVEVKTPITRETKDGNEQTLLKPGDKFFIGNVSVKVSNSTGKVMGVLDFTQDSAKMSAEDKKKTFKPYTDYFDDKQMVDLLKRHYEVHYNSISDLSAQKAEKAAERVDKAQAKAENTSNRFLQETANLVNELSAKTEGQIEEAPEYDEGPGV
jgi:hypothetical protein